MNSKINKIVATILVTAMVLSIIPAFAQPLPPAIWVEPQNPTYNTGSTSVGFKFNVTVWISTLAASYTWQAKVTFNATQLNAVRADYTGAGKSLFFTGHGTVPVSPVIDNVSGSVTHGESLVGADSKAAGSDTLFWIEFQIMIAPGVGETLTSLIDTNNVDTFLLDPNLDPVMINKGFATYTYSWSAPPKPHLAVDPALRVFDQYTMWVGTTFTEDIVIHAMNGGWYLTNATTYLAYNTALLAVTGATFNALWGTTSFSEPVSGDLLFVVSNPSSNPSGDVLIATVTFQIIYQGNCPPLPVGTHDDSPLDLHDYSLFSSANIPILTDPETDGLVQVYAFQALTPPHLKVSSATVGPGPSIGTTFDIDVSIVELHFAWNLVGIQFRLAYDAALIEPILVTEGPFMPYWAALEPGSLGTFFISFFPEVYPVPHVLVGNMIYPDGMGVWHAPLPEGTGVIATITFRVIYQSFGDPDKTCPLEIIDQLAIGLDTLVDQNIVEVPLDPAENGVYTITTNLPGRNIDLYGGAVNNGYGSLPFPPPYGGQGQDMPMDLVTPQSWVQLYANVTYNYWPVQHKMVGFEVIMPSGALYVNLFAYTDENGVATIGFRMPWPCDDPEANFGVWWVISTVSVGDVVIRDDMFFHYDYLVNIFKVTTDKYEYNHGEYVCITITYGSHAQQVYPVLIKTHIKDELGVVIGESRIATTVGGTVFCQYKNWTITTCIYIPKWAYAGIATIHVNVFDKEPVYGGVPVGPEYTPAPTIAIQPY